MKNRNLNNKTILLSRTDSIGDVVLTLPMCVWIKQHYPQSKIIFLGNTYTEPVLACMPQIDEVMVWHDLHQLNLNQQIELLRDKKIDVFIHVFPRKAIAVLAKKAAIAIRVGTLNRLFHLFNCNIRPYFSRKKSDLNEAQLNFELLRPFGLNQLPDLKQLSQWMTCFKAPDVELPDVINKFVTQNKKIIILHPKSQGSALEWPLSNYLALTKQLIKKDYLVIFTGTEKEGVLFRQQLPDHANCLDSSGLLTLSQLIKLIACCDALVACSTGPLHLAGILGRKTIGLFSSRKPIHPARWKPLGNNVHILVNDPQCPACQRGQICHCIENIAPEKVLQLIEMD